VQKQSNVNRRGRARTYRRRKGKQEDAPPPAEVTGDEAAAGGEEESDVPEWCDPSKPMGAWLNYKRIRVICGERGFTDFGPYGGVPSEEGEGGEDGGEDNGLEEEVPEEA
jgi:hypothetical protein